MNAVYPAIFKAESVGGYSVTFPDLRGCVTEGDTLTEALTMAQEALGLYLVSLEERNLPVPAASDAATMITNTGEIISLVMVEVNEYRRTKSVNTMVTLPAWLKEAGEQAHVNFSGVLQEALKQRLGY